MLHGLPHPVSSNLRFLVVKNRLWKYYISLLHLHNTREITLVTTVAVVLSPAPKILISSFIIPSRSSSSTSIQSTCLIQTDLASPSHLVVLTIP